MEMQKSSNIYYVQHIFVMHRDNANELLTLKLNVLVSFIMYCGYWYAYIYPLKMANTGNYPRIKLMMIMITICIYVTV